jgi:hypothetical protein
MLNIELIYHFERLELTSLSLEFTFLKDLMLVNNGYQHHLNIDHMSLKI